MLNIILVTPKRDLCYPNYTPSENKIVQKIINANKDKLSLQILYSEPTYECPFFKRFPLLYINNKIIDNHSLLFFLRDLLYSKADLPKSESSHFSYLISFLKGDYRQIYISDYYTLKQSKRPAGFPMPKVKAFHDFFCSTKERDYVKLIIKTFIEEYQSVIPTENISFNVKEKEISEAALSVKDLSTDDIIRLIEKHSMPFNLEKVSLNESLILQNVEVKGWRNSFYSLGIFLGISVLWYMFSNKLKQ